MQQPTDAPNTTVPRQPRQNDTVADNKAKRAAALDEALKQTFPASDPIVV